MIIESEKHSENCSQSVLRLFCIVLFVIAIFVSPAFCSSHQLELFGVPKGSIASKHDLPARALRQRPVKINFGLLNSAVRRKDDTIIFNFFDDVLDIGSIEKTVIRSHNSYSILGSIDYEKEGSFIITVKNDVVLGNIHTPDGKHYMIHFDGHGHVVRQVDDKSFAACATDEMRNVLADPSDQPAAMDESVFDDASTFDVLVVYTPAALAARGGITAMEAHINLAVDEANTGYANSLITPRIRLVHTEEISYTETAGFETALDDLTGTSDGKMDNVHSLRNTHGADFVCLFIDNPDYCGIAWLMQSLSASFESAAFSVVAWDCATGYYSFAHELGHNMGCTHATPESPQGEGVYNYSMGWRFAGDAYRTVMAYSPGTRINYFSNPDVSYAGYATGVALGQPDEAHNALTINNVASTVANFRQEAVPGPPIANDSTEIVITNTPKTIQLDASDEGQPDPPGAMDFIILTLPAYGALEDAGGSIISAVPYILPGNTKTVVYIPDGGFNGTDSLQFKANDGAEDSNIATVTVKVSNMLYFADMQSDPGFTLDSGGGSFKWQWGSPSGSGGGSYGNPDPTAGYTGSNVLGYNLGGDYKKMSSTQWATTPAIDCSGVSNTMLTFYRWLNVEESTYDHAYVQVSNDGSSWLPVWENTAEVTDSSWVYQSFDISPMADGQPTVYIRWGMGSTDTSYHYSGWNIDDVLVSGNGSSTVTGDIDNSKKVDLLDFVRLYSQWHNSGCIDPDRCNGADIIKDGTVGIYDLLAIANYWLETLP